MVLNLIRKALLFSSLLSLVLSCSQSSSPASASETGDGFEDLSSEYEISLNTSGLYSFIPVAPSNSLLLASASGYNAGSPGSVHTVEIANTGTKDTGNLKISISGPSAAQFSASKSFIPNIAPGGVATFAVTPKTSLPEGDYTAVVSVTGTHSMRSAFSVKQSISPVPYYTVSFDSRGAGLVPSQYVQYSELLEEPIKPVLNGYIFDGWYADTLYTDKWDFANDVVLINTLLFAKWTKETVYVSVRFENVGITTSSFTVKVEKGTPVSQPANMELEGYTFVNWYSDPYLADIYNFNWPVENNIVLYAKWLKDVHPVKFYSVLQNNLLFEIDSCLTTHNGQVLLSEVIPEKEAYHFKNWYVDPQCTVSWDFVNDVVTEPLNLYAGFLQDVYIVRFDGGISNSYPLGFASVAYGEKIAAPANLVKDVTTSQYYTFSGWYTGLQDGYLWDFNSPVTKSMVLYARWVPRVFTVTFETNNSDPIGARMVEYGNRVEMPAYNPDKQGLYFYGWSTALSGGQVFDFNAPITKDTTIYAIYYAVLTFYLGDQYAGQRVVMEGDVIANIDAQLKYFTLSGWYTEPNGIGDKWDSTKPITSNLTLYSYWIPKDYTLVVNYNFGSDTSKPDNPQSRTYTINWNTLGQLYAELNELADTSLVRTENPAGFAFLGWTWKRLLKNWYERYVNHQHYETLSSVSVDFTNTAFFEKAGYTDIVPVTDAYGSVSISTEKPVTEATIYALWSLKYAIQFTRYDDDLPDPFTADGLRREIPSGTRIDPATDWTVWVMPGAFVPIPYEVLDWFRQNNKRIMSVYENDSTYRWSFNRDKAMRDTKLGVKYDNHAYADDTSVFYSE